MASTSNSRSVRKRRFTTKQVVAKLLDSDDTDIGNDSYNESDLESESDDIEDSAAGSGSVSVSLFVITVAVS